MIDSSITHKLRLRLSSKVYIRIEKSRLSFFLFFHLIFILFSIYFSLFLFLELRIRVNLQNTRRKPWKDNDI